MGVIEAGVVDFDLGGSRDLEDLMYVGLGSSHSVGYCSWGKGVLVSSQWPRIVALLRLERGVDVVELQCVQLYFTLSFLGLKLTLASQLRWQMTRLPSGSETCHFV